MMSPMPKNRPRARGWFVVPFCVAACAWLILGCGDSSNVGKLVPVVGKVSVDGTLLKNGSVSFRPDKAKGNNSVHEPAGDIDEQGTYKLYTATREGAPPGWYKVLVNSAEAGVYPPTKFYANAKYGDIDRSDLKIEVVEQPAAGAYDLKLKK
jgi:hypothetical protein